MLGQRGSTMHDRCLSFDKLPTLHGANVQSIGGDVSAMAVLNSLTKYIENFDLGGTQLRGQVYQYDFMPRPPRRPIPVSSTKRVMESAYPKR